MTTVILQATTKALTPFILVFSVYLLLRGHDAPGGGFIAALVAGAAVVLQYLANGIEGVNRFIRVRFVVLLACGLLIATGVGVAPMVLGAEFLSGGHWEVHLPLFGEVKLASSLIFDLGVYLVVLAVILVIVRYLGEEGST